MVWKACSEASSEDLGDNRVGAQLRQQVSAFLEQRHVRVKLCSPTRTKKHGAGIELRYPLKLAVPSPGSRKTWHGTQLYYLAAILQAGFLIESTAEAVRTLIRTDGTSIDGVYLHGDESFDEALLLSVPCVSQCCCSAYSRCSSLC